MSGGASRSRWPLVLAAGLALAVVVVARGLEMRALLESALARITGLGPWAPAPSVSATAGSRSTVAAT